MEEWRHFAELHREGRRGGMRDEGGGEAGGKVKGTSSAHCWGLATGCEAEGKRMNCRKEKKNTHTST